MKFIEMLQQIERVDQLIRLKATGSASQLANRLNISERTLHRLLSTMKELGAPINYNSVKCSYYYDSNVEFQFGFKIKNNNRVTGGLNIFAALTKSDSRIAYFAYSTLRGGC